MHGSVLGSVNYGSVLGSVHGSVHGSVLFYGSVYGSVHGSVHGSVRWFGGVRWCNVQVRCEKNILSFRRIRKPKNQFPTDVWSKKSIKKETRKRENGEEERPPAAFPIFPMTNLKVLS